MDGTIGRKLMRALMLAAVATMLAAVLPAGTAAAHGSCSANLARGGFVNASTTFYCGPDQHAKVHVEAKLYKDTASGWELKESDANNCSNANSCQVSVFHSCSGGRWKQVGSGWVESSSGYRHNSDSSSDIFNC